MGGGEGAVGETPHVKVNVRFRSEAAEDVSSAYSWYEAKRPGLGGEFVSQVENLVELLLDSPEAFPVIAGGYRRALLTRFPYALYYRLEDEWVEVFACLHMRRSAAKLRERASEPEDG